MNHLLNACQLYSINNERINLKRTCKNEKENKNVIFFDRQLHKT